MANPGGWSDYKLVSKLTEADQLQLAIIKCAQPDLIGAEWTPVLISTQVVEGANYRIIYLVSTVTPQSHQSLVMIEGFRSLDGKCTNKSHTIIADLGTARHLIGGWSAYRLLHESEESLFREANNIGVERQPFCVATQLVNGVNYRFITLSRVLPNNPQYIERVSVYKPFCGKGTLGKIEKLADLSV